MSSLAIFEMSFTSAPFLVNTFTSTGMIILSLYIESKFLASSIRSGLTKDFPIETLTARKVLAIPPPSNNLSHFGTKDFIKDNLSSNLAPPIIIVNGFAGSNIGANPFISLSIKKPMPVGKNLLIP